MVFLARHLCVPATDDCRRAVRVDALDSPEGVRRGRPELEHQRPRSRILQEQCRIAYVAKAAMTFESNLLAAGVTFVPEPLCAGPGLLHLTQYFRAVNLRFRSTPYTLRRHWEGSNPCETEREVGFGRLMERAAGTPS